MIELNPEITKVIGTWHIQEMSEWESEYLNMEIQAFIRIDKNAKGEFHFRLVSGELFGGFEKDEDGVIFKFTWEGSDEGEYVSGDGWIRAKDDEFAEGEIRFHSGDISHFMGIKVKPE